MNLFELFNNLDSDTQNLIKIFYLGFGTPTANLLNSYKTLLGNNYNTDNTLWRYKMSIRPDKEIHFHGFSGLHALAELNIAFLEDEPDSEYKNDFYIQNCKMINIVKEVNLYRISNFHKTTHGTSTAIIIKNHIPILTKYDNPSHPFNTLWRSRVRRRGGTLSDKNLNDLKHVCYPEVYNYLSNAYIKI